MAPDGQNFHILPTPGINEHNFFSHCIYLCSAQNKTTISHKQNIIGLQSCSFFSPHAVCRCPTRVTRYPSSMKCHIGNKVRQNILTPHPSSRLLSTTMADYGQLWLTMTLLCGDTIWVQTLQESTWELSPNFTPRPWFWGRGPKFSRGQKGLKVKKNTGYHVTLWNL